MKNFILGVITGIAVLCVPAALALSVSLFTDVADGQWYTHSVTTLYDLGIIKGYPDASFRPGANVNRAELSVMLEKTMVEMGDPYAVCKAAPYQTDIGRMENPVSYYYKRVSWLGGIFTADDCFRLDELYGGTGADYTWGSSIVLKRKPWQELINTFKEIGYTCTTEGAAETDCKIWDLSKTVKVGDLLKLKGYSEIFDRDDCINCG